MYQRAEQLADGVWEVVVKWTPFAMDTVGKQLTKAADSIGANIAESAGRFHPNDVIHFLYYARGSLYETRYWLRRAIRRRLITDQFYNAQNAELDSLGLEINSYIKFQRTRSVKESDVEYHVSPVPDNPNEPTN
jgi:four helix bundle protein